jgi:hypothetical protein
LDENGEVDEKIEMKEAFYLIFKRGQNDESLELISSDNSALPSTFPTKYNRSIGSLLSIIFSPKDALPESLKKLSQAHNKYYQKANKKEE